MHNAEEAQTTITMSVFFGTFMQDDGTISWASFTKYMNRTVAEAIEAAVEADFN